MPEEKKTVGITADNYKLEKFKKELIAGGFTNFEVKHFKKDISLIKVTCLESDFPAVGLICKGVQDYYQAMKN